MADPVAFLRPIVLRHAQRGICNPLTAAACAVSDYTMALWGQGISIGEPERVAAVGQCIRAFPAVRADVLETLRHDH